jgi:antitoxin component YwqK of YwqJK toxin-antitoxin module
LDGPSIENFPSGMKKSETFYRFGKKEGVARQWDERGTLLTEENWQSDHLEGRVREFFSDGKPRSLTPYLAGKKNGRYESFNPDGTLATSGEFLDGKLQGPITLHYPAGQPFAECDYQGDLLTGGRLLYPDGKALGQFGPISGKEGKVSFLLLQYPDGKPLSTARFDAATGKTQWKGWNLDGSLLGQMDHPSTSHLPLPADNSSNPQLSSWKAQQESLEQQIGLTLPPEFNLLPR